jgi:hypothetical protein
VAPVLQYIKHEDESVIQHPRAGLIRIVCREDRMIRFGTALALIGISAVLYSCSSRHEAMRTELRQQQPIEDEAAKPTVARRTIEPAARNGSDDVTSSIGRAGDIRPAGDIKAGDIKPGDIKPWPRRGTPEWEQLQAEEIAREQRIKEVLSSICRGC